MSTHHFSACESVFISKSDFQNPSTSIPYIIVDSCSNLGLFVSLRFLEWAAENPQGVISLPTGKTPEYFIKWTQHLLANWDKPAMEVLRKENGLQIDKKPELGQLRFVQIDEFYPISPEQQNSFYNYVQNFYIQGFGLNANRGLFINCETMPRSSDKELKDIFPNHLIDLSLRNRDPQNSLEEIQQKTILLVDQWCADYEAQIRLLGGIGFFLGGIGPDGHIAFNVRGSDHNSTSRLTETNFETQAAAAMDLGGIEISRNRLVVTIGLSTITYNPEATALVMAAGDAKAKIVQASLENQPDIFYPATVLKHLKGSRFYLTKGAAGCLREVITQQIHHNLWNQEKTERALVQLCQKLHKYAHHLTMEDLENDPVCSKITGLDTDTVPNMIEAFKTKLDKGLEIPTEITFLHTGPHHDDIMLGYLPHIIHLIRSPENRHYFANMTSGFTSVTNSYLKELLTTTADFLYASKIQMVEYPDFFDRGYKFKWAKDVYHYLDRVAANNKRGQTRGLSHRLVRILVEIYGIKSKTELTKKIQDIIVYLDNCYDGEKNSTFVQQIKGMIREFEEELVWSHYGVQIRDIHHLRLGFYKGDIFSEVPQHKRDVEPVLELLRNLDPTVITVAFDPEGSGPDTHYKVLQTIAEALRIWQKENDLSSLRIWGYRNVWHRFDPSETDIMIPVSLNSMATLRDTFMTCYLSQKNASFPSYELDGPFCDMIQKIWVEQHELMELILGRDFWYQHNHPRIRATHGLVFLKEFSVEEFLKQARTLATSIKGSLDFES
jgi:glucosamine-6-phosphate deaminase|tara:strand:+ start:7201 stop:9537 length:2337 start_codon:yes stop_codon:yes gene_type:complete